MKSALAVSPAEQLRVQQVIGETCYHARKQAGLGRLEAATAAGIDRSTLSRLERGQLSCRLLLLVTLGRVYRQPLLLSLVGAKLGAEEYE